MQGFFSFFSSILFESIHFLDCITFFSSSKTIIVLKSISIEKSNQRFNFFQVKQLNTFFKYQFIIQFFTFFCYIVLIYCFCTQENILFVASQIFQISLFSLHLQMSAPPQKKLGFVENFLLSGAAAVISKTAAAPIERVKLLVQNQGEMLKQGKITEPYKGVIDCTVKTMKSEGNSPLQTTTTTSKKKKKNSQVGRLLFF